MSENTNAGGGENSAKVGPARSQIARAIYMAEPWKLHGDLVPWSELGGPHRAHAFKLADAVLALPNVSAALSAHSTGSAGVAAEPVAWAWESKRVAGYEFTQFTTRRPSDAEARNIRPLYEHPPVAAAPYGWAYEFCTDMGMERRFAFRNEKNFNKGEPEPNSFIRNIEPLFKHPPPAGGGETMQAAREALGRMKAREGEDVDQWADRLSADLAAAGEAEFAPAPPAGDLISLSAEATEGRLRAQEYQEEDPEGICIIAERYDVPPGGTPTNGLVLAATLSPVEMPCEGKPADTRRAQANANFVIGLWNAYRSGRLVEAAPADRGETQAVADLNPSVELSEPKPVTVEYLNWRGEQGQRRIMPNRLVYGATEWHPRHQWLIEAFDLDKGEMRLFAWEDMQMLPSGPDQNRGETQAVGELEEDEMRRRAKALILGAGWKLGDKLHGTALLELMVKFGSEIIARPPQDHCGYPGCGCDADAVCRDALAMMSPSPDQNRGEPDQGGADTEAGR